jgi:predicted  nucleic acid-binding Zn-ribbon protein
MRKEESLSAMLSQAQGESQENARRCEELDIELHERDRQISDMFTSLDAMDMKASTLQNDLDMEVAKTATL